MDLGLGLIFSLIKPVFFHYGNLLTKGYRGVSLTKVAPKMLQT